MGFGPAGRRAIAGLAGPRARPAHRREGELVSPWRCHGDDATPADVGCTQSRMDGSVRTRGARLCKEPQEGCGVRGSVATGLGSEDHEVAARRARQLGVGVATLAPCCELKSEAGRESFRAADPLRPDSSPPQRAGTGRLHAPRVVCTVRAKPNKFIMEI